MATTLYPIARARAVGWDRPASPQIDWGHPLTRSLKAFVLSTAAGAQDIAAPQRGAASATVVVGHPQLGIGIRDGWSFTDALSRDQDFAGDFTVMALLYVPFTNPSSFQLPMGKRTYTSEASNSGWELQVVNTNVWAFNLFNNNGAAQYRISGGSVTVGVHVITGTVGSGTKRLYVDGVQVASNAFTTMASTSATFVSDTSGEVTAEQRVRFIAGMTWARELSPGEVMSMRLDPWQMLQAPSTVWVPIVTGGANKLLLRLQTDGLFVGGGGVAA